MSDDRTPARQESKRSVSLSTATGSDWNPQSDHRVEVDVPDRLYAQMKVWAEAEGVSVDELADRALREHLGLEKDQGGNRRSASGEK